MSAWNGRDFYTVQGGRDDPKRWQLARRGFLNGGPRERYWRPLEHLEPGHRIFAYVARRGGDVGGYVGIGEVIGEMMRLADATETVEGLERPLTEQPGIDCHFIRFAACEMVVPVEWTSEPREIEDAFWEPGLFSHRNTACKLTDQDTIDRVLAAFNLDRA